MTSTATHGEAILAAEGLRKRWPDGSLALDGVDLALTRAEVCTAADNSCLMHIGGALRRQRTGVRAMHLAEILAATA